MVPQLDEIGETPSKLAKFGQRFAEECLVTQAQTRPDKIRCSQRFSERCMHVERRVLAAIESRCVARCHIA